MTTHISAAQRKTLSGAELQRWMALAEKSQQLAGHFPDAEALGRTEAILRGELSYEEALEQIAAKYANG
ncbi:antitoxin VbhA family protein [Rudaeicoccus suwonensis]|uniref:Antitoxin VbhA domain-containing protein n=1 Tax=Rudaeicoccus suwonensis TaxID=657409 RepID=A0A561E3V9_9MICO|nr:antitoxin VbhA family protein [Rudaeicoccus suwonensis]TWE10289.1 hypothetical protein BKA23_2645 [Rudaeicoccus suwonensis]